VDYDQAYRDTATYFGGAPDPLLEKWASRLESRRPVLDVGCGQGRNSVYLARQGLTVHSVDSSRVAINQLQHRISEDELAIRTICACFSDADLERDHYGGILVFGLVQELEWPDIGNLTEFCRRHLAAGGLLFVTAFSTLDPIYPYHHRTWQSIGHNSYRSPEGGIRTYLDPDQILALFDGYDVLHHWEGLGPEHSHGDGPPERHGRVETVLRRQPRE
jgi:cyclopropane fatty-acyl-phospholipid synthase-like methyltransferase